MLKKFFISMLGTMAGLWISLAVMFFGGLIVIGMIIGKSSDNTVKVQKHSFLQLNLSGEVLERYQPASFFDVIQMEENDETATLEEMIKALDEASTDQRIEGVYLCCKGAEMGPASHEELLAAIKRFRSHGKWVYAYSGGYTQGDYILASAADKIVLNPIGSVDLHGMGAMVPFYTGLLDKLGIKMQIIKVGTFKSAVEPYILESISEPARKQMQQYCDTIWNFFSENIAYNRGLDVDSIRAMASQMIFTMPADYNIKAGLVDTLLYPLPFVNDLFEPQSRKSDGDLKLVSPREYLASSKAYDALKANKRHIAVLYAVGEISDTGKEGIVSSKILKEIYKLAEDDNVAGMVLRVNSPGGSAYASEQIWESLSYFKKQGKPLYVSMGDYAASGGYYISCGADSIFADYTTITGSIGVFGMIPDLSGLVTDKLGVTFSTVETNPNAIGLTTLAAMTPEQHNAMQRSVDSTYSLFTSRVAEGRNLSIDYVREIAEGRVWVGADAVKLGLVDTIGSLNTAIDAMADKLGLDRSDYVSYPIVKEKIWEQILRDSEAFDNIKAAGYDAETLRYIREVQRIKNAAPIQARMYNQVILN